MRKGSLVGRCNIAYYITCTDHLRCWRVETLLIRVSVLGNEALENRNALWLTMLTKEMVGRMENIL